MLFNLQLLLCQTVDFDTNKWVQSNCGVWMSDYTKFHESMMYNSSANYVISIAGRSGLTDTLVGMVTHFLYALLSKRIFLRLSFGKLPRLENVFSSPNINWTSFDIPEYAYRCMKPPYVYHRANKSGIITITASKCSFQRQHLTTWNNLRFYPLGNNFCILI